MTYQLICSKSNITDATSGAGTAYFSEKLGFTFGFSGVRVAQSLVFLSDDLSTFVCLLVFFLSFEHCIVCPIYDFCCPFGIFQTFLIRDEPPKYVEKLSPQSA